MEILNQYIREFNPELYLKEKVKLLNQFFLDNNLNSVVLGISGGIDSALVLKILMQVPTIKKIVPCILPIKSIGSTGQEDAESIAKDYVKSLNLDYVIHNLGNVSKLYNEHQYNKSKCLDIKNHIMSKPAPNKYTESAFAIGQLDSILRTPFLYFQAAILQTQGYGSVVSGTSNRDESAFIGFYGKASDGMNDIQPISDLHKSEVYKLAEYLEIPYYITDQPPMGGVYDSKTDEEMIGAPYWFLQAYQELINRNHLRYIKDMLSDEDFDTFIRYEKNILDIHKKNRHKYQVGLPAHHFDVLYREVHFKNNNFDDYIDEFYISYSSRPDKKSIPGSFFTNRYVGISQHTDIISKHIGTDIYRLDNVISDSEANKLIELIKSSTNFEPVSVQGRKDIVDDRLGSIRTTMWNPRQSSTLYERLNGYLPNIIDIDDFYPSDWWQNGYHRNYKVVGLSPLLRCMIYKNGGEHYAHYDAGYIYEDSRYRSLMSFVLYLTTNTIGATRFINDNQSDIPVWNRNHDDYIRPVEESEIYYKSYPVKGSMLLFPHRLAHDVEPFVSTDNDDRIIIRGDIVFKKC